MFKHLFFVAMSVLMVFSAQAFKARYWNPNGSGNWADDSRWTIVDSDYSDRIIIQNGDTATMTEADFDFVATQSDILFTGNSKLEITVSNDATFPEKPSFTSSVTGNGGAIIKKGSGKLTFGRAANIRTRYNLPTGGVEVVEGELQVLCAMGPITVTSPGVMRPPQVQGDFYCYGLRGDGTVYAVDPYTGKNQFIFAGTGGDDFTGTFIGKMDFTVGGKQILSNPAANDQAGDVRCFTGEIWLNKIGKSGQASSIGSNGTFWFRGNPFIMHYTGTGEEMDKAIRFGNESGVRAIDGGPHGGLIIKKDIYKDTAAHTQQQFVFDGAAGTKNIFGNGGNVTIVEDGVNSVYLTKQGAGEWEFSSNPGLGGHGAIAVKEGTLSYTSIAEQGVNCALGYSDILYQDYSGAIDPAKAVDYAFLLGNGSNYDPAALSETTATMKYTGTAAATCTTRPIHLAGAGRLASTSANGFQFSGIKAVQAKSALVLNAPAGSENAVSNLDRNGNELTVIQEGAGDWKMSGTMNVSAVDVRAGKLTIKNVDAYEYFRFQAMESYNASEIQLGLFGLWDADGNLRSENITYHNCVGDASQLLPGEVTDTKNFSPTGGLGDPEYTPRGRTVENLFKYSYTDTQRNSKDIIWSGTVYGKGKPLASDENTWPGFIIRLRPGKPVVAYDLYMTTGFSGTGTGYREIKSWRLEGSRDGVNWVKLDEHIDDEFDSHLYLVWHSSKLKTHAVGEGYAVTTASPQSLANLSVRSDLGATLTAEDAIGVSTLTYDSEKGAGTIEQANFASSGTLVVNGLGTKPRGVSNLAYTLNDCQNLSNLANWTVILDGTTYTPADNKYRLTATTSGIALEKIENPFLLLFK